MHRTDRENVLLWLTDINLWLMPKTKPDDTVRVEDLEEFLTDLRRMMEE